MPRTLLPPHIQAVKHPNKLEFEGVMTRLNEPSDGCPRGSGRHRIIITSEAAQSALPSLIGQAINFSDDFNKHNRRQKAGVITDAEIIGNELHVKGYLFSYDFPELLEKFRGPEPDFGMSYDIVDAKVEDMRADVLRVIECTFIGAALLFRVDAAYKSTRFRIKNLEASQELFDGTLTLVGSINVKTEP